MAYMNADTSAKIGFRPYYQTDPFGAAHLSGLGQNHPFKPQAWHLHGVSEDGLGLYAPSWFAIPTASSQRLQAADRNMPGFNRGGGAIVFPGPGGMLVAAPAHAADGTFLGTYHLNRPFDPWELYPDVHETAGVRGLGYLGDGVDPTQQAADELLAAGHITQAEHDAILEGSMTFQDVLGFDPTDQSTFTGLTDLLRETNQQIISLENQVREANVVGQTVPGLAQVSAQVNALRQAYTPVAAEYIRLYVMMLGGPPPSGLSGLGVAPLVWWVVGSLAAIVTIILTAYKLHNDSKQIDVNAALAAAQQQQAHTNVQEAQTNQQLVSIMQSAQARGDTVTAQAAASAIKARGIPPSATGVPNPPPDLSTWFMTNAKWLGLGAAGLIVLGPLSEGLFGRRRR